MRSQIIVGLMFVGLIAFATTFTSGRSGDSNPYASTQAALNLFVDVDGGSDSNACTSAGAACATIQGAINLVPKIIRHPVTVSVASGTYSAGATVENFEVKPADSTVGAWLILQGTFAAPAVALVDGGTTGTATAATFGANASTTWGTLTNSAQTWSANDLTGKWLQLTGGRGAGQVRLISSNTGTVATIAGSWLNQTPSTNSTYAIVQPATIITGSQALTVLPDNSTIDGGYSSNKASIVFQNNHGANEDTNVTTLDAPFKIRRFKFASTTNAQSIYVASPDAHLMVDQNWHTSAATDFVAASSGLVTLDANFVTPTSGGLFGVRGGERTQAISARSRGNIYNGTGVAVFTTGLNGLNWYGLADEYLQPASSSSGWYQYNTGPGGNLVISGMKAVCSGSNVLGALLNPNSSTSSAMMNVTITSSDFTGCQNVVVCRGRSYIKSSSVTGTGNTTVWTVNNGCMLNINSGTTATGTTEISMDGTAYTYTTLRELTPTAIANMATTSTVLQQ